MNLKLTLAWASLPTSPLPSHPLLLLWFIQFHSYISYPFHLILFLFFSSPFQLSSKSFCSFLSSISFHFFSSFLQPPLFFFVFSFLLFSIFIFISHFSFLFLFISLSFSLHLTQLCCCGLLDFLWHMCVSITLIGIRPYYIIFSIYLYVYMYFDILWWRLLIC